MSKILMNHVFLSIAMVSATAMAMIMTLDEQAMAMVINASYKMNKQWQW